MKILVLCLALFVNYPHATYIMLHVDTIDLEITDQGKVWKIYKGEHKISVIPYREGILARYDNHIELMCPHIRDDYVVVIYRVKNRGEK